MPGIYDSIRTLRPSCLRLALCGDCPHWEVAQSEMSRKRGARPATPWILLHWFKRNQGAKRARPRPKDTLLQPKFGEWLSLVEHLVRDQGVGGSNPLSPTIVFNYLRHLFPLKCGPSG